MKLVLARRHTRLTETGIPEKAQTYLSLLHIKYTMVSESNVPEIGNFETARFESDLSSRRVQKRLTIVPLSVEYF